MKLSTPSEMEDFGKEPSNGGVEGVSAEEFERLEERISSLYGFIETINKRLDQLEYHVDEQDDRDDQELDRMRETIELLALNTEHMTATCPSCGGGISATRGSWSCDDCSRILRGL